MYLSSIFLSSRPKRSKLTLRFPVGNLAIFLSYDYLLPFDLLSISKRLHGKSQRDFMAKEKRRKHE